MGITVLFVTHNIDDAVYSAAVLVMSSLPTVIMENIVIDLPDERPQLKMRWRTSPSCANIFMSKSRPRSRYSARPNT